jgi:hypothetical protein
MANKIIGEFTYEKSLRQNRLWHGYVKRDRVVDIHQLTEMDDDYISDEEPFFLEFRNYCSQMNYRPVKFHHSTLVEALKHAEDAVDMYLTFTVERLLDVNLLQAKIRKDKIKNL